MENKSKIQKVPTLTEMLILESVEPYQFELSSDDVKYPEYKFIVPGTEYEYTVNLDGGSYGNNNDYEVTFYFGEDDGGEIYSKTNNLGINHLYTVLSTMDKILIDAAKRFPVRDFVITGESTESEKGDGKVGEANTRTKMYLRYIERNYPSDYIDYENGIIRIHAYKFDDSLYSKNTEE